MGRLPEPEIKQFLLNWNHLKKSTSKYDENDIWIFGPRGHHANATSQAFENNAPAPLEPVYIQTRIEMKYILLDVFIKV